MKKLFPIIGGGSSTHQFTKSIFEVMLEDEYVEILEDYSEETYKAYFNGSTGISKIAKKICAHMEPENFASYIDEFSDATRESLCKVFEDIIPDLDSFNISLKLSELFADILREAASTKRNKASKKGALPKVEIPNKSPSNDIFVLHLSENDRTLLNDFHADFDNTIEKCIADGQADILFLSTIASNVYNLFGNKWKTRISQFEDISLQSDVLNTIATLQDFCKTLNPDAAPASGSSVRKLKIKLRDNYVKLHPDSFAGIFPYDAFIDDWDDESL